MFARDGRGISSAGETERECDRGRALDAGLRPHDDIDSTKIYGVAGGGLSQG